MQDNGVHGVRPIKRVSASIPAFTSGAVPSLPPSISFLMSFSSWLFLLSCLPYATFATTPIKKFPFTLCIMVYKEVHQKACTWLGELLCLALPGTCLTRCISFTSSLSRTGCLLHFRLFISGAPLINEWQLMSSSACQLGYTGI